MPNVTISFSGNGLPQVGNNWTVLIAGGAPNAPITCNYYER